MSKTEYAATETVYRGDTPPTQQFQLYDRVSGNPIDFTLYPAPTVSVQWAEVGGSVAVLTKAATIEGIDTGWVSVSYSAADFVAVPAGLYEARVVIDTGSGEWTALNRLRYRLLDSL